MELEPSGRALRTAVVLCLTALYFVLAVGVTLLGSGVYRAVAASARENSTRRIALSYVANQVRRCADGVAAVGDFRGVDALRLFELADDGTVYATYLYCYEGQLRELYTESGTGLGPADGTALIALSSLEFRLQAGGLLTVTAADTDGNTWSVDLYPRTGIQEVERL